MNSNPDLTPENIEKVAKAIWSVSFKPDTDDNSWDGQGVSDETRECVRAEARAAIEAMDGEGSSHSLEVRPGLITRVPEAWRPISTAPKDGTRIIAWFEHLRHPVIAWVSNQPTRYSGDGAHWCASHGWTDKIHMVKHAQPTHWMPLPIESPAASGKAEGERESKFQANSDSESDDRKALWRAMLNTADQHPTAGGRAER